MAERLTMTVPEMAEQLGISLPTAYTLSRRSDFPTVKIGYRTLISTAGLAEWVRAQEQNRKEVAR